MATGDTEGDILKQYPSLEPEDIRGAFEFATNLMGNNYTISDVV